jgi:hypothetical protein
MKTATFAIVTCLSLCGCATFNLGTVKPQAERTADQQQLDTLTCKDQARLAAEAPGEQTREFLLGLTLVGYPLAIMDDRIVQRQAFTTCMTEKGYAVTPAT